MEDEYFKKIMTSIILIVLIVLTFLLLKPILLSIIVGIILAYILSPIYNWLYKKIKSKNLSASIICLFLIILIIIPFWFLTPIIVNQSLRLYIAVQQIDVVTPLKLIFPSFFISDSFTEEVAGMIHSFLVKMANYLVNSFTNLILNFPTLFLRALVVFFTFYFVIRDKEELLEYIKGLLPFSKEVEKKLFDSSKGITSAVIYGQVIVGILQGMIVGVGFIIFQVPNAFLLTILAAMISILPLLGPYLVWVPVVIYLFIAGNTFSAIGVSLFGLISSIIDNFLRPLIVSRRTKLHSSVVLIGMVGGLFMFGVLGLILGPLILAYMLIILELYRNKKGPGMFTEQPINKS